MKSKLKIPGAVSILLFILLLAVISTWIIPGGKYTTQKLDSGATIIDENSFEPVEHNAFKLWNIPSAIMHSAASSLSVILICAMGNCLVVMANSAGTFYAFIAQMCKRFKGKESKLIVILTVFFSLLGFVVPPQCFIGFTGTIVVLSISIGYDSIIGLSIVMLSVACSAMSGPLNSITAIAQAVVGLPIYSGILVRFISYFCFLFVSILYFLAYGKKIRKDSTKSYMYGLESADSHQNNTDNVRDVNGKDRLIFSVVILIFAIIAIGSMLWNWSTEQISAIMLVGGVVIGIILRYSLVKIFELFVDGIKELTGMYVVIVLANTIGIVLKSGNILDTIIHASAGILSSLPGFIIPFGVMIFICIMNVILPSGAGKAVMMMPIIAPIGQIVGMSAQTSVLAYTFGDGFSNYMIPHDASNISYLNAAKIPYTVWIKYMTKLFLIWNLVGGIILTILYYIGYGPF